jgi:predicted O-methyltransferase YrrM
MGVVNRMKVAARQKLQRAVAEVVSEVVPGIVAEAVDTEHNRSVQHQRDLHDETMAALDKLPRQFDEMSARLAAVNRYLDELEQRVRRDISHSQDILAARQSAAFVLEHMPKAPVFWHPHDTLRFALGEIKGPGLALEFGVATGTTLAIIADAVAADRAVVGFDSFTGLPEAWRTGFPAGEFAQDPPADVPGATIVPGLFDDTLPDFLAENDEPIAFVHLDADLYSSTKTVLDLAGDRLAPDVILLFDEFFNYPGWQAHEFRAWTEFVAATGRTFEYLAYTGNSEQVVVRLH